MQQANGDYLLAGGFSTDTFSYKPALIKTDVNGNLMKGYKSTVGDGYFADLIQANDGFYVMTGGSQRNTTDFIYYPVIVKADSALNSLLCFDTLLVADGTYILTSDHVTSLAENTLNFVVRNFNMLTADLVNYIYYCTALNTEDVESGICFRVFPNPSTGEFTISAPLPL